MTQDEEIKEGDTVTWKHLDGPRMFVKMIHASTLIRCQWFGKNDEFFTLDFEAADLEVEPHGGPH